MIWSAAPSLIASLTTYVASPSVLGITINDLQRAGLGIVAGIATVLVQYILARPKRLAAQVSVASAARAVMLHRFGHGRVSRMRRAPYPDLYCYFDAARRGELGELVGFGATASHLGQSLTELREWFLTETATPYLQLRSDARKLRDAFVHALAVTSAAAAEMTHVPPVTDEDREREGDGIVASMQARSDERKAVLGTALGVLEASGEDLGRQLDAAGAAMATRARLAAAAALHAKEDAALAVLVENARAAVAAFGDDPVDLGELAALADRLKRALDIGLHVDAASFQAASQDVRDAHHQVVYGDFFESVSAVDELARGELRENPAAKILSRVARLRTDLAALERLVVTTAAPPSHRQ